MPCPFHSACEHQAEMASLSTRVGIQLAALPFFPTITGAEVTKSDAVCTINRLVSLYGSPTIDAHGRNLFGGHSLRTGGAVTLSGLGLDSARIEGLARWSSPMLLHYAKLAPLRTLTQEYRRKAHEADVLNSTHQLEGRIAALEATLAKLTVRLDNEDTADVVDSSMNHGLDIYVKNFDSNKWHLSVVHEVANSTGITECKWRYTRHNSFTSDAEPTGPGVAVCNRCLPRLAAKARGRAADSSTSTSSTSS